MTLTYLLPIDQGTIDILKGLIHAVHRLGRNCIHPRKEVEGKELTSNQVGNLSRPRFHGLVAKVKENPGHYCITNKGVDFLKGRQVDKYCIVSKVDKKQVGYYQPGMNMVTIHDVSPEYWEFPNIEIVDGQIVEQRAVRPTPLFDMPASRY